MSNKLQELTDKLYNEGLSKGKEEGELLLAQARVEADKIRATGRREAALIVAEAEKEAAALKEKAESDIRMASAQSLQATRKDIEDSVAGKFSASEPEDISLVLPASMKKDLEKWVSSELAKALGKEVKAEFTKKIQGGFTIGPRDGSWFVSFTDETFRELIAEYLRPVTRKILFG